MAEYVLFRLDTAVIGLPARTVDRIVQAVEITLLPQAPRIILGVINVSGAIIPVVNFRSRFGLPDRDVDLSDRFVIVHTATRSLALHADAVEGVVEYADDDITHSSTLIPELEHIMGIARGEADIVFIHDLERFLSVSEASSLDAALASLIHEQQDDNTHGV